MSDQLLNSIFKLKFESKMLHKQSIKKEKEMERIKKKQVSRAIKEGNLEKARIYSEMAIRRHKESIQYLKMSSKLDQVRLKLEQQQALSKISKSMKNVTKILGKELKGSLNLMQMGKILEKVESKMDDLEIMDETMQEILKGSETVASSNEVEDLIQQFQDEKEINQVDQLTDQLLNLPSLDGVPELVTEKVKPTKTRQKESLKN
ncbi:charged multivesicular body protein 1b [Anaeramoeba flamelloides]|uniref:Charged multivesicular body protein 1b n=2 Tax=Anaeramoeba flamelloides TaxID=1746091 RepID=A0ABQ8XNL2_9EUKA|nr:charged multivesicular body protein 1b [Anaeramoeba flamelloides]